MRFKLIASCLLFFVVFFTRSGSAQTLFEQPGKAFDKSILDDLQDTGVYDSGHNKTGKWIEYLVDTSGLHKTNTVTMPNGEKKTLPGKIVIQKSTGSYINGIRTGEWRIYKNFRAEKPFYWDLQESSDYLDGKLNGWWNYYDVTGMLLYKQHYIDNVRQGKFEEYYSGSGKIKRELQFDQGLMTGTEKIYFESGQLQMEATLREGKYEGVKRFYYSNGKLWAETEYKNGGIWNAISNNDPSGKPQPKGTLKNGTGSMLIYDEAGKLTKTYQVKDGQIVQ